MVRCVSSRSGVVFQQARAVAGNIAHLKTNQSFTVVGGDRVKSVSTTLYIVTGVLDVSTYIEIIHLLTR